MNGHSNAQHEALVQGSFMNTITKNRATVLHGDSSSTDSTSGTDDSGSGSDDYGEDSYP